MPGSNSSVENGRRSPLWWITLGGGLVAAGAVGNEILNNSQNNTADTEPQREVEVRNVDNGTDFDENEVEPTPVPTTDELEAVTDGRDTSPGLNMFNLDLEMDNAGDIAQALEMIGASEQEVIDQNLFYRMMFAEPVYGFVPVQGRTPEEVGLGFTENSLLNFDMMQRRMDARFTSESLIASHSDTQEGFLVFRSNPTENNSREVVFYTDRNEGRAFSVTVADQYDNVYALTYQQALDVLKVVTYADGTRVWDTLTPAQRDSFAEQLVLGWDNQRVNGPVMGGSRDLDTANGTTLMRVDAGNGGFAICRVEAAANTTVREDQVLTTEQARIIEQDDATNIETQFNQLSRFGRFASIVVLDVDTLNEIARSTNGDEQVMAQLIDAVLNDAGRHERVDLESAFNNESDSSSARNVIPTAWEIGGLNRQTMEFEENDFLFLMRPCGQAAAPVETPVPVLPTEVPPYNPPVETPPPEEPTPTPEPPKSDPGDQTNPDGETENPPEGGQVIIDGEIDTDGDGTGDTPDNVGSGR